MTSASWSGLPHPSEASSEISVQQRSLLENLGAWLHKSKTRYCIKASLSREHFRSKSIWRYILVGRPNQPDSGLQTKLHIPFHHPIPAYTRDLDPHPGLPPTTASLLSFRAIELSQVRLVWRPQHLASLDGEERHKPPLGMRMKAAE
jgi:hypothetical protein